MTQWIDATKRRPEPDVRVLVHLVRRGESAGLEIAYLDGPMGNERWHTLEGYEMLHGVSHWMPLPGLPGGSGGSLSAGGLSHSDTGSRK